MEIVCKYRGKRIDTGEWVFGYLVELRTTDRRRFAIDECRQFNIKDFGCSSQTYCYEVDPDSIGQSIGIKDKNGKEIFGSLEKTKGGDVVSWYNNHEKTNTKGIIIWESGCFHFLSIMDKTAIQSCAEYFSGEDLTSHVCVNYIFSKINDFDVICPILDYDGLIYSYCCDKCSQRCFISQTKQHWSNGNPCNGKWQRKIWAGADRSNKT
jgi:uncharacterized phage protein (TIGR01671 family)